MHALLLIDIQNDYFAEGKMELIGSEVASEHAQKLLFYFRTIKAPIFHIQHISSRPDATFFLPHTSGVNFHASVAPIAGENIVSKNHPNAFHKTTLLQQLRELKIDSLFIAGMMTHMCIDTTVRAAYDLGLQCTVAHDACATRDLKFEEKTIPAHAVQSVYMASLNGVFAKIENTETICRSLSPK